MQDEKNKVPHVKLLSLVGGVSPWRRLCCPQLLEAPIKLTLCFRHYHDRGISWIELRNKHLPRMEPKGSGNDLEHFNGRALISDKQPANGALIGSARASQG